jgi:hypothetical protein
MASRPKPKTIAHPPAKTVAGAVQASKRHVAKANKAK